MKRIIDISDEYYKAITEIPDHQCTADMLIIKYSIPHETVTEFADRCKECGAKYGKLLKQQSCEDAISRQAVIDGIKRYFHDKYYQRTSIQDCRDCLIEDVIKDIPPVTPQPKQIGHCKDCKYFEYDSWAKVDGIPLIVAHEICNKWGDGCKSKEDGYCFLFEPKMQEVEE